MFHTIPSIYFTSQELLRRMEKEYFNYGYALKVNLGDIFLQMGEYLKVYAPLLNKYDSKEINKEKEVNPHLAKLCDDFEKQTHASIDFYLARLMQRPTKYPLLINAILEKTPLDHPERHSLEKAYEFMKNIAMWWNEQRRMVDRQGRLLTKESRLNIPLVLPSRFLLENQDCHTNFNQSRETFTLMKLCLCNDVLILSVPRSFKRIDSKEQFLIALPLSSLSIFDLPDFEERQRKKKRRKGEEERRRGRRERGPSPINGENGAGEKREGGEVKEREERLRVGGSKKEKKERENGEKDERREGGEIEKKDGEEKRGREEGEKKEGEGEISSSLPIPSSSSSLSSSSSPSSSPSSSSSLSSSLLKEEEEEGEKPDPLSLSVDSSSLTPSSLSSMKKCHVCQNLVCVCSQPPPPSSSQDQKQKQKQKEKKIALTELPTVPNALINAALFLYREPHHRIQKSNFVVMFQSPQAKKAFLLSARSAIESLHRAQMTKKTLIANITSPILQQSVFAGFLRVKRMKWIQTRFYVFLFENGVVHFYERRPYGTEDPEDTPPPTEILQLTSNHQVGVTDPKSKEFALDAPTKGDNLFTAALSRRYCTETDEELDMWVSWIQYIITSLKQSRRASSSEEEENSKEE